MSDKKIVVSQSMMLAVANKAGQEGRVLDWDLLRSDLEAALRWLSENPIVPTEEQSREAYWRIAGQPTEGWTDYKQWAVEWQRRMFLAPESEVPEAIRDLLPTVEAAQRSGARTLEQAIEEIRGKILEAYKRGKASK